MNALGKIIISSLITLYLVTNCFSQTTEKVTIKGYVNDNEGKAIQQCLVAIVELNKWTTTDSRGYYELHNINKGTYTIVATYLGMQKFEKKVNITKYEDYKLDIKLKILSFAMEEVVVLSKEDKESGSSSIISKTAVEHLQASSLKDVLQLLPGKLSVNPNLSHQAHINIRDLSDDANSSFGTAVIINGAPLNNSAEIRTANTSNAAINPHSIDVRQIGANNIESVEVIRGVAPAMYGDMTSGAVIVKTKSGYSPLNAKISISPNIRSAYIGKGFVLKNFGAVNLDVDYTQSVDNTISPYKGFNRLSAELGYSYTFMKRTSPLSLNIKAKYHKTVDSEKIDPDIIKFDEYYIDEEQGYRINLYGRWNVNKTFITNINYNFSYDEKNRIQDSKTRIGLGYIQAVSNARTDTLKEGVYVPSEYDCEMKLLGKPYNLYASLSGNTVFSKDKILNNTIYGLDFRTSGNKGEGRIYDEFRPPRLSQGNSTRPRAYKDIPAMKQVSFFIENKTVIDIYTTQLMLRAGLRYNNYQAISLFKSSLKQNIEPRINAEYTIINNADKDFSKLSLFAAYGIQSKSPAITHLYPDVAYFDLISFNYFSNNPNERLLLVNTKVFSTENKKLEPIITNKYELGLRGKLRTIKFNFTGYYERTDNGLNFSKHYEFTPFKKWEYNDPNIIYAKNKQPIIDFNNPTKIDTFNAAYSKPENNRTLIKKGIEYRFDFPKISSIKTRFNLSGAYLFTKSYRNKEYISIPIGNQANQLPYVSIFDAGEGFKRSRLNSNIIAITNIPKLKLVFSTTLQIIWLNKYDVFLPNQQPIKYTDQSGKTYLIKVPIALMDKKYNQKVVTNEEMLRPENELYISKYEERYFFTEKEPIHFQINLKISSEIGKYSKFAFFVNNISMYNPKYETIRTNTITTLNSSIYFGMELTFLL